MERIPVAGPWITEREIEYVRDAAANAWYANANMYHERFEGAFGRYLGRRFAMALPSCTAALHLTLASLRLEPGDEVVVPDITWIASTAPVSYVGAIPVFADVDPHSWCLDPQSLEAVITPRTRAIIPVDLYGNLPDMEGVMSIAARHGLAVIEDAAQAVGAESRGRKAGTFGIASTFSFHGTKTLTTGEGGMLVSDSEDLLERCHLLRDHGRQPGDKKFWNVEVGFKYRMSSMQAALGLAQLERIDELVARKREIFAWYLEALADIGGIELNHEAPGVKNTYWMVTVVVDADFGLSKEDLLTGLSAQGVDCRPFFYPLSSLPAYGHLTQAKEARARNLIAYDLSGRAVNLPSGFNMTRDHVTFVGQALRDVLGGRRRGVSIRG